MTHASLFSGIGGPEVAAAMLGWDNLFHCEINEFGRKILDYWFPNSKSYEDITKTDFSEWRGKVNVLTGGFPCQPFSYAGKRRGADDDRYLWPYMFKAIDAIRPAWIVAENVAGITTMVEQGEVSEMGGQASMFEEVDGLHRHRLTETFTLQRICNDLEGHGYAVQPVLVPACAVGAPHRRDRVFIVARRSASDTDNGADRRTAREDEGKGGEERLQERHEIRQPDQPNQVRRESERNAAANTKELLVNGGEPRLGGYDGGQQEPKSGGDNSEAAKRRIVADTDRDGLERPAGLRVQGHEGRGERDGIRERPWNSGESIPIGRWDTFPSVSPVHRGNDGIPFDVDRLAIPFSKWRTESLKAYGNAIVPQVMYEIFRAIDLIETNKEGGEE